MAEEKKLGMMEKTEAYIDKSRRVCTLSDAMIKMLTTQLAAELSNKHLYMTFANYFGTSGLPKLEEYFKRRADEEELHHYWIWWYLGYCDAEFHYPAVGPIDLEIPDHVFPFKATVDKEIETTMRINEIVEQALKEKDWTTYNWLMGTDKEHGMLVKEQNEEESVSRTIADMAQEGDSWLIKQNSILSFYLGYPNMNKVEDDD